MLATFLPKCFQANIYHFLFILIAANRAIRLSIWDASLVSRLWLSLPLRGWLDVLLLLLARGTGCVVRNLAKDS